MSPKIHSWQWPNVLAIDAALIAVVWQWTLASALGLALPGAAYVVLALSVWLTYAADRLFDVARRPAVQLLSARHRFAKRHARTLWRLWAGILIVDLTVAFTLLPTESLRKGTLLLVLCLAYTVLNQKLSRRFFPKEAFVALIFTGGVVVFQPTAIPLGFTILFALLCLLNCLVIGAKEKAVDNALRVHSIAPHVTEPWLGLSALTLLLLVCLSAPPAAAALGASYFALGLQHLLRSRCSVESFRVWADLSLLVTPILLWLF